MAGERDPLTQSEYEQLVVALFQQANDALREFGNRLADYCWNLDNFANAQNWESRPNRLIVFGVPEIDRRRSNGKNYFSIYAVQSPQDHSVKCEVILPKTSERAGVIDRIDPRRLLSISTINEVEGYFEPVDYEYLVKLILFARDQRLRS